MQKVRFIVSGAALSLLCLLGEDSEEDIKVYRWSPGARWGCQNISTAAQRYFNKHDFMKAVHLQQRCALIGKGTVGFMKVEMMQPFHFYIWKFCSSTCIISLFL